MDLFKNRVESFTRPKRAKGAANVKTNSKWPHPESFLATPDTLAEAGFYFDPSSEDKDSVSCYMCGKQLAEWAENDDPFEIHFKKCGKKCAWANVRCGLRTEMDPDGRFVFTDKNRLPASKAMEKCRLDTFLFGDGWIHDGQRNHGASSKKMAKAGFVYAPQEPNDDTAVCLYCGISLSGWDAEDDPTEEHRKRVKKSGNPCPMFPDIVFLSPPLKASKAHSRSKSKSSHVDVTIPLPTDDSDDDESMRLASVASSSTAKTPKPSRTVKKGAKTPGSRSVSKSQNIPVFNDNEAPEEVGDVRPTSRTRKTSTTARAQSISRTKSIASLVDSDAGTGTEDDMALTRSTRSRGKTKDTGRDMDEESTAAKKKGAKTSSKSKTRVSVIHENDSAEAEELTPPPTKPTKKSLAKKPSTRKLATAKSSSSLKQKQYTEEEDLDNDLDTPPSLPPTKKSASKSKPAPTSVVAAAALFDDDDEGDRMEVDESEPTTARPTRATRKSTRQPLTQSQDNMRPSTTKKRGTHSRTASTASRAGKSRAPPHVLEDTHSDDPLDMQMYIPPASISSVDPDPDAEIEPGWDQKAEGPTAIERQPSKSKAREKPLPVPIQTDVPEQDVSNPNPPPIPPRSPSRPRSKTVLRHEAEPEPEVEVGIEVASESQLVAQKSEVEGKTTTSDPRRDTRQSRSAAEASKPRSTRADSAQSNKSNPLLKSATMTRKGSFLGSRSSTQSHSQNGAAVLEISSDEGEEDEVESVVLAIEPTIVHETKPKILTNAKPPRVKPKDKEIATPALVPTPAVLKHTKSSVSRSDNSTSKPNSKPDSTSRPASIIFQEGSVQAKIAQIEKTAETEQESGGKISPFKPALTLTNSFHADLRHKDNGNFLDAMDVDANVNKQEIEDRDIQMVGPLDSAEEEEQKQAAEAQAKTEAEMDSEAQIQIPPPKLVVTPPRAQPQHRPASPFKTPFRLGTTPGNPFSVPPTPGVPMDLPLGVPIPLSKELFIPTQELSDAELSMTVEEWVRHHKQIEYEKFRVDGERRIEAFLRHAEQTRRAIEGL